MRIALLILTVCLLPQDPDRAALKKEFEDKRDALRGVTDPDRHVELGNWCLDKSLKDDAKWAFQKAWDLKKGCEGARAGMNKLGYDLEGDLFRPVREIYDKRRRAIPPDKVDARYELAEYIRKFGLEKEWRKELDFILKVDPDHKPTRTALGFTRKYGEWLMPEQLAAEKRIDDAWKAALDAKKSAEEILVDVAAAGWRGKLDDVKQILKFAAAPVGAFKDVKLEAERDKYETGEYTYGIPTAYQPWRKTPLIVFLHGGGAGVGDGDDYFPQIWPHSGPRGYLTVCPTVLEKVDGAWNNERHEKYLRAIVKEFRAKYNVDEERTYLMGHSMGGFGCFYLGTRTTDVFACISPWSGGPGGGMLNNLKYTPCYIIHSKRDEKVSVEGSREADRQLTQLKYYHVYVELDVPGHGIPGPEQEKAVDWLDRFRLNPLAVQKKK